MKFGLKDATIEKINNVFSKYKEIEKVVIFGSRAKGNYRNGSDIDLCFSGENLNLEILHKIDNDLDDLFLPYSFDLSIYIDLTNRDFIEHIDRVGLIFYQKENKSGSVNLFS